MGDRRKRNKARRNHPAGAAARGRKWLAATAMAPVLALPAALLSASALPAGTGSHSPELRELGASGNLPQAPELNPRLLDEAADPAQLGSVPQAAPRVELPTGELGIPEPVLAAYMQAAREVEQTQACGLHWSVLASIGRIESGHARNGDIDVHGTTAHAILGPQLSGGPGVAAIPDTDAGRYDGDPVWDRAVGPMQFIPSTWRKVATDGNLDGVASPHNLPDAAAAAGTYLCESGEDLSDQRALAAAVFRYNHSEDYVRTVLVWADAYRRGVTPTPAELAPESSDVLAGARATEDLDAMAMPEPEPLTIPEIAPVPLPEDPQPQPLTLAEPAPGTADPHPAPAQPAPEQTASEQPAPQQPASEQPPLVAPVEPAPPESPSSQPPSLEPTPPPEATSVEPTPSPETKPSQGTTPPAEPKPSEETTPPAEPKPSEETTPPAEPKPSEETTPPAEPKPSEETTPPAEPTPSGPMSSELRPSEPLVPMPSTSTSSAVIERCETSLLDRGEFAIVEPDAGEGLEPGESTPLLAQPGNVVFTAGGGVVKACTVPDGYAPEPR